MVTRLVVGAPASGKSTYVQRKRKADDIVIDLDLIAQALGSNSTHDHPGQTRALAAKVRDFATANAPKSGVDVWIVSASPDAEKRIPHDESIYIDPGRAVCEQRAHDRPRWTFDAIRKFYEARDPNIKGRKNTSRKW